MTSTISRLFKMPGGQQPYLGFFGCQQNNNHIWAFLDASRTTTIFGLLKRINYRFSKEMSKR